MKNNQPVSEHSPAWIVQTWVAFLVSIAGMVWGIWSLGGAQNIKMFMTMGLLFVVSSSLGLAKTTRDVHESKKILSRIDEAKLQEFLSKHDPYKEE